MNTNLMLTFFKIGAVINGIAILIAFIHLVVDAIEQSTTDNVVITLIIVAYIALLTLGYFLKLHNHLKAALIVIWVPAFPVALMGIVFLLLIIINPDFK
ncbi:hypothetical protein [Emticicia sp. C21]|uniref:hypothetical protein n=1 Tax=Emticicia sp. C21 TaxID=2302915 RepID=UPI0011C1648A|nr:hypothetical protein [Emticicia sp. C21]